VQRLGQLSGQLWDVQLGNLLGPLSAIVSAQRSVLLLGCGWEYQKAAQWESLSVVLWDSLRGLELGTVSAHLSGCDLAAQWGCEWVQTMVRLLLVVGWLGSPLDYL
jgi:hypothetical protein